MSKDKHLHVPIFAQIEAIVFIILQKFFNAH